jgi:hypothetical protein
MSPSVALASATEPSPANDLETNRKGSQDQAVIAVLSSSRALVAGGEAGVLYVVAHDSMIPVHDHPTSTIEGTGHAHEAQPHTLSAFSLQPPSGRGKVTVVS